ncbi:MULTISPECIES: imelysin family protein [Thalassospira]|uniref:Peptidase M75, Imelysin n=1 Tax=Thalassospira profundimaris TaxID=502049 RepID=A0A367V1X5_9PROT|nr:MULTISPECIES: imelysin family protein [Thalassospira]KZB69551.1 peptidase M75, Imelysin [Thalassospira sp. MCCC 1A01148]MBR9900682.1 imelysin family protein [Rhodospirillales bacterium]RCK19185.1 peptidase M75, Imelysin [Thalassospira profundimaris]
MIFKPNWRSLLLSTTTAMAFGLASPGAHADIPDENYQAVLAHLLGTVMPPKLDEFHASTETLTQDFENFCSDPDAGGLEDAQTAFHAAMDIWQEIQPWRMGPLVANGRDQHIEYWPDKHGTAARQFRKLMFDKPAAYTDPEKLAGASAALQGFPALEEVLFADDHGDQMIAADEDGVFLCQYGTAIATNLGTLSAELQEEWPAFATAMENAGPDSMDYPTAKFAATDLYRALHEGLLIISTQKLARPLGENAEDARASRAESPLSKRSLRNIEHNLIGLFAIYDGKWGDIGEEGKGLAALIENSLLDRSFRLNWQTVGDSVAKLPPSVTEVLEQPDGYETLTDLKGQIEFLTTLVENDVGGNTQLGGGFNALDGD